MGIPYLLNWKLRYVTLDLCSIFPYQFNNKVERSAVQMEGINVVNLVEIAVVLGIFGFLWRLSHTTNKEVRALRYDMQKMETRVTGAIGQLG